jgi:Resolvase, N terminal domain
MDGILVPDRAGFAPEKIARQHRERLAIVYIRQSTPQQVERNQESTRLQYALADRAFQFGWARETILTIDDDLGRSGSTIEGRLGFQRLVAEVGLGHVGAGSWRRDVPPGAIVPGLASTPGDLRAVRYADRRRRWGV